MRTLQQIIPFSCLLISLSALAVETDSQKNSSPTPAPTITLTQGTPAEYAPYMDSTKRDVIALSKMNIVDAGYANYVKVQSTLRLFIVKSFESRDAENIILAYDATINLMTIKFAGILDVKILGVLLSGPEIAQYDINFLHEVNEHVKKLQELISSGYAIGDMNTELSFLIKSNLHKLEQSLLMYSVHDPANPDILDNMVWCMYQLPSFINNAEVVRNYLKIFRMAFQIAELTDDATLNSAWQKLGQHLKYSALGPDIYKQFQQIEFSRYMAEDGGSLQRCTLILNDRHKLN